MLDEVPGMVGFAFVDEPVFDEGAWRAVEGDPTAPAVLDAALVAYEGCAWEADELRTASPRSSADGLGLKLKKAQNPIRVAVTGKSVGPPLFQSLELLGREAVRQRLRAARQRLGRAAG